MIDWQKELSFSLVLFRVKASSPGLTVYTQTAVWSIRNGGNPQCLKKSRGLSKLLHCYCTFFLNPSNTSDMKHDNWYSGNFLRNHLESYHIERKPPDPRSAKFQMADTEQFYWFTSWHLSWDDELATTQSQRSQRRQSVYISFHRMSFSAVS